MESFQTTRESGCFIRVPYQKTSSPAGNTRSMDSFQQSAECVGCRQKPPIQNVISIVFPYDHRGGNFASHRVVESRSPNQMSERKHRTMPTMTQSQLGYHCFRQNMRSARKAYPDVGRPLGPDTRLGLQVSEDLREYECQSSLWDSQWKIIHS